MRKQPTNTDTTPIQGCCQISIKTEYTLNMHTQKRECDLSNLFYLMAGKGSTCVNQHIPITLAFYDYFIFVDAFPEITHFCRCWFISVLFYSVNLYE